MKTNVAKWFAKADQTDIEEGVRAYANYRLVMEGFAGRFGFPLDLTTAAFVALSPNTDYLSNLRSLVSVLDGLNRGVDCNNIVVSTYNHNRDRAISYLTGVDQFDTPKRGRKIRSFYRNIINPETSKEVTVDGHMVAIWRDEKLTMKEATVSNRQYDVIEKDIASLAKRNKLRPCEMQAVLWFTRKRVLQIKFDGQLGLFDQADDRWGTRRLAEELKPYSLKR